MDEKQCNTNAEYRPEDSGDAKSAIVIANQGFRLRWSAVLVSALAIRSPDSPPLHRDLTA